METKIELVKDLIIPDLGDWSSDAVGDWLHPAHGPLPDLLSVYRCEAPRLLRHWRGTIFIDELCTVALWVTNQALLTSLELYKDEDPDPRSPPLTLEEAYTMRGWILQSYRWVIDDEAIECWNFRIPLPETKDEEDETWSETVCRMAMRGSVKLATTIPVGVW